MISAPELLDLPRVETAIIHLVVPRTEMAAVFGPAVQELFGVLARQGVESIGPVFAHHRTMPPGLFDFELGVAVVSLVAPEGRVEPGALPAGRVAHTTYTGPYEGLHAAWGRFDAWFVENGLHKAVNLWEVYGYGPDKTPDPATYRTELYRPLRG